MWSACAKLMISKLDWPVVNFPELAEKLHLGPAGHARGILAKRVTWAEGKELLRAIGTGTVTGLDWTTCWPLCKL